MSRRLRIALSPSRASDYQRCPLQYRLKAIDKIPEPKTVAQVKGTLVHKVLEDIFALARDERTYPRAVKMLKPSWSAMVEKDPELHTLVPDAELMDFLVECRSLLRGYFEMENPLGFDPHAREQFVNLRLPNGVPVRGFIDRVDVAPTGEVRVVDYKTGKKPKPQYAGDAKFQMRFYALVYWRLHGVIPHQLRLMYLKVIDDLIMQPSKEELEYFERDLEELWSKITRDGATGNFEPRKNALCDWCSFHEFCPVQGGTPPEYPGWPDAR
ncbi:PD-(D/E)XK nuclease superfamily protein [Corynebacterium gerontici]|uniref:PD-(D/E)XK nuclease superfamily protein n=2 Tax=Corynebacterium gerontici TaxID=2079234 RepID=A0A3G6J5Y5_9CORY|nr:RecB family exonuclease [Corynebacterium gerontici]AZA11424.1 PD-(D/E)XK nuclease superfamily protein [Corynebacterium gerontici]